MDDDSDTTAAPTRRAYVKCGGAVLGGGLLAGCSGQSDSGAPPAATSTEPATQDATSTGTATATGTDTPTDDGSYTVEMFPVGEVAFETVPQTWMADSRMGWADMAVAAGQADGNRTATLSRASMFYDQIDVDPPTEFPEVYRNDEYDKEVYYELDADVHLLDPNVLIQWNDNVGLADIDEISSNVAPFFGCYLRRFEEWMADRGYRERAPTMLEAFEKVGRVFRERERTEAMLDLHEEVRSAVDQRLSDTEPVEIANVFVDLENGTVVPIKPTGYGYAVEHFRELRLTDVFEGQYTSGYYLTTDMEGLLEADPDHIVAVTQIHNDDWHWNPDAFTESILDPLENDPLGRELTAVQNGTVHPGGYYEQGPIINLFYLEFTAQQLYPDQFGAFPFEEYPEVPEENQLFDRQRVADIVRGEI